MNWPYPPTKLNQTSEFLENGPISETPRMRWLSNAKTSFEKLILVAVAKLILQVDYHRDFASGPWHSDGWSRTSWSQWRRAERCVYRTAALLDAGAAEDKGLVREVVVLILPLQRALRAGSHNAQRTLDQAWLRHSAVGPRRRERPHSTEWWRCSATAAGEATMILDN